MNSEPFLLSLLCSRSHKVLPQKRENNDPFTQNNSCANILSPKHVYSTMFCVNLKIVWIAEAHLAWSRDSVGLGWVFDVP